MRSTLQMPVSLSLAMLALISIDYSVAAVAPPVVSISQIIELLGSEDFTQREASSKSLLKIGRRALPDLERTLRSSKDLEVLARVRGLIESIDVAALYYRRMGAQIRVNENLLGHPIYALSCCTPRNIPLDLKWLSHFPELHILEVCNHDKMLNLNHLKVINKLTTLRLSGSHFNESDLMQLADQVDLQLIQLDRTDITNNALKHIGKCRSLQDLNLGNTAISDAGLCHLKQLKQLAALRLEKTGVTDSGLEQLKCHSHLILLDLSDTKITDKGLKSLVSFKKLRYLFLRNTAVTDAGIPYLQQIPSLEEVYLGGTKISKKRALELKSKLPRLQSIGYP